MEGRKRNDEYLAGGGARGRIPETVSEACAEIEEHEACRVKLSRISISSPE